MTLLSELAAKHQAERVACGFDDEDLTGWFLAFGRELLMKMAEEAERFDDCGECEQGLEVARRLRELASAGEGKNG
jgi:hypothetical protein